ncbi:UV excision repair protein Rad23 [Nadsonia fulvescens var. elongata DSM 6958]|uniref:UV excision repair protein RAD23 n=1 Tax=Nadsonia fulvescens var. elongata DSM 6958 TaxID=857566 RepID=A0A1E3PEU8_9ASCO|nr:UV excision repair protein Rad23 [Nadsonia fulvescens var. elongata DSM 6958]
MKLTFKNLKQQKWVIEVEPTDTVLDVKTKNTGPDGKTPLAPADQKLIYSGKILQDDKTVESYNIKEKDFIVCMITAAKKKPVVTPSVSDSPAVASPAAVSPPATVTPSTATTDATVPEPASISSSTTLTTETATTATPAATNNSGSGADAFATGSQRDTAITNMVEMGYPRDQVDRAMRAAFNNPDRAVEYLLTGIPAQSENANNNGQDEDGDQSMGEDDDVVDGPGALAASLAGQDVEVIDEAALAAESSDDDNETGPIDLFAAAASHQGASTTSTTELAVEAGDNADLGELEFLRSNPQFQQVRELVQQNPNLMEPILQQLVSQNPQLGALINSNPDGFIRLLTEGLTETDFNDDEQLPPGAQQLTITVEENDAIDRLVALGFDKTTAAQAYFACDKNEELAANFLFENSFDD